MYEINKNIPIFKSNFYWILTYLMNNHKQSENLILSLTPIDTSFKKIITFHDELPNGNVILYIQDI